jgi:hypothetical protein
MRIETTGSSASFSISVSGSTSTIASAGFSSGIIRRSRRERSQ